MTVCISPYIPTIKAMRDIYIRIFLLSFLLLLYHFGEEIAENMVLDSPLWAFPKSITLPGHLCLCWCLHSIRVSPTSLTASNPANRSQIKSLQSKAVLTALGDSRGYSYRRSALVMVLFCWPLPARTAPRCLDSCSVLCTDIAFSLFADKED